MVWEGRDAVKTGRSILGATNPLASAPGTIRGDFALVRTTIVNLLAAGTKLTCNLLGCRPQRLPRQRQRRERQEGDRSVVQGGRGPELEAGSVRLGLREGINALLHHKSTAKCHSILIG